MANPSKWGTGDKMEEDITKQIIMVFEQARQLSSLTRAPRLEEPAMFLLMDHVLDLGAVGLIDVMTTLVAQTNKPITKRRLRTALNHYFGGRVRVP
jgi:hypothetical protein